MIFWNSSKIQSNFARFLTKRGNLKSIWIGLFVSIIVFFPPVRPVDFPFYPPVKSPKTKNPPVKNPPVIWSHGKNQCVPRRMFASDLPLRTCSELLSESWSMHGIAILTLYLQKFRPCGARSYCTIFALYAWPFLSKTTVFWKNPPVNKKSTGQMVHFEKSTGQKSTGRQKQKKNYVVERRLHWSWVFVVPLTEGR